MLFSVRYLSPKEPALHAGSRVSKKAWGMRWLPFVLLLFVTGCPWWFRRARSLAMLRTSMWLCCAASCSHTGPRRARSGHSCTTCRGWGTCYRKSQRSHPSQRSPLCQGLAAAPWWLLHPLWWTPTKHRWALAISTNVTALVVMLWSDCWTSSDRHSFGIGSLAWRSDTCIDSERNP